MVGVIQEEDDEPGRYLALIAAANQEGWQVAEVWLEDGDEMAINDLGEGLPLDDVNCPGSIRLKSDAAAVHQHGRYPDCYSLFILS